MIYVSQLYYVHLYDITLIYLVVVAYSIQFRTVYISLQYDSVDHLSTEVEEMFKNFADTYTNGYWIYTSAKDGHNVQDALCQIIGLV